MHFNDNFYLSLFGLIRSQQFWFLEFAMSAEGLKSTFCFFLDYFWKLSPLRADVVRSLKWAICTAGSAICVTGKQCQMCAPRGVPQAMWQRAFQEEQT
jgi:hypothetical protein